MLQSPDVSELLQGELGVWLESQKELREETRRKIKQATYTSIAVTAVALMLAWSVGASGSIMFLILCFGIAGWGGWTESIRRPVIESIKERMNNAIAAALGLSYSPSHHPGDEWPLLREFDLLPNYDEEEHEDNWRGQIGAYPFSLFETYLHERRGSGNDRKLELVFHGVIITIGYGRPFKGTTLVEQKGTRFKFFGLRNSVAGYNVTLKRADFTHPDLAERFDLWTSDPVEAQYLVHPIYIERLIAVGRKYEGNDIRALFHKGLVHIVIETKAQFESGSLRADQDVERLHQTVEQFMSIAKLADTLYDEPGKVERPIV